MADGDGEVEMSLLACRQGSRRERGLVSKTYDISDRHLPAGHRTWWRLPGFLHASGDPRVSEEPAPASVVVERVESGSAYHQRISGEPYRGSLKVDAPYLDSIAS